LRCILLDKCICDEWLDGLPGNRGEQLIKLVAIAANWDRVLDLWEILARRCKQQSRAASAEERDVLIGCVAIHNQIWKDRAAQLNSVDLGSSFDYLKHERGCPSGELLRAEWLPGLSNAAGKMQKKTLVET
jgi:hypothetical protein